MQLYVLVRELARMHVQTFCIYIQAYDASPHFGLCRIIDHFSNNLVPLFYRVLVRQDKEQQKEVAREIQDQFHWLEEQVDSQGPYFMGKDFSMVDIALLPWFIRLFILEHYRGFGLPADCKKLAAWH